MPTGQFGLLSACQSFQTMRRSSCVGELDLWCDTIFNSISFRRRLADVTLHLHHTRRFSMASKCVPTHENNPAVNQGRASTLKDMVGSPERTLAALPSLVDLEYWAPRGKLWSSPPQHWVVFSDLHLNPGSLPVCMEILRRVHAEAETRGAGIAFLGDFWHHRGSLPVEPLNEVVKLFSTDWKVPTLMLVGNHDQVSLGGLTHALTPIAAAAPDLIHVFSGPAFFMDALWISYRRNQKDIEETIASANGRMKAVFAHADVIGAAVNAACQAKDGLRSDVFPTSIPCYLGHYHKPQVVPGTTIRYVGSPYQVTRAESNQKKSLVVLDRKQNWDVIEEIPLDIGPRHWTIDFPENDIPKGIRSGDRVRILIPRSDASTKKMTERSMVEMLTNLGASVETVLLPSQDVAPRIKDAEDLGPVEMFQRYAEHKKMSPRTVEMGTEILNALQQPSGRSAVAVSLSFKRVEIEGFISFKTLQSYDLDARGLVVITGQRLGDTNRPEAKGLESNGAGKTALAMAPLWALTGEMDARSDSGTGRGLINADIVNEDSKFARVRIEGLANGVPFVVERRVVRQGRGGGLWFELNGEDMTGQEIRLTQSAINYHLGVHLLGRTSFYGQSEITALLESTDKTFKEELGKIVDVNIWSEAKDLSRKTITDTKGEIEKVRYEIDLREGYLCSRREELADVLRQWEEYRAEHAELLREQSQMAQDAAGEAYLRLRQTREILDFYSSILTEQVGKIKREEGELQADVNRLHADVIKMQRRQGALEAEISRRRRKVQNYRGIDADAVCDLCLQPLDADKHSSTLERLEIELENVLRSAELLNCHMGEAFDRVREAENALGSKQTMVSKLTFLMNNIAYHMNDIETLVSRFVDDSELAQSVAFTHKSKEEATNGCIPAGLKESWSSAPQDVTALERSINDAIFLYTDVRAICYKAIDSWNTVAAVQEQNWKFEMFEGNVDALQDRIREESSTIEVLRQRLHVLEQRAEELKSVDEAFRPTGIVSYILESALGDLQQIASQYLAVLSPEISLEFSPSQSRTKGKAEHIGALERIEKRVYISGSPRSLKQLSGGERRRVALALALAFTEFAAMRGKMRSDLLVLDEVTQHLDREGCSRAAALIRGLESYATVLMVAQAGSYFANVVDCVDVVAKKGNTSIVLR